MVKILLRHLSYMVKFIFLPLLVCNLLTSIYILISFQVVLKQMLHTAAINPLYLLAVGSIHFFRTAVGRSIIFENFYILHGVNVISGKFKTTIRFCRFTLVVTG